MSNIDNLMVSLTWKIFVCFHSQSITLDSDSTPVLQIKTHRLKSGKMETSHYKVTVSRLRARLTIKISYTTLKGEMTVEGYPDVSHPYAHKYR